MTITKDDLEKLYLSKTNEESAQELNVSVVTFLKMIDQAGIDRKGKGNYHNKIQVVL